MLEKTVVDKSDRLEISIAREIMPDLLGPNDAHLRYLEDYFQTTIIAREASLLVPESEVVLQKVIRELSNLCRDKAYLEMSDIETILRLQRMDSTGEANSRNKGLSLRSTKISIKPRTPNQELYLKAMREFEIVFSIGPAGTGKTFLAVAHAVSLLESGNVERIVLVRPVVEAGEKLGFLPGDIKEKVDPFFRPLYDALLYMMSAERVKRFTDQSIIEIAPLAYMRGRTLNHSIVILDEAQNTTSMQMKMFLTRLGAKSRAVVTGDITQIDLEMPQSSGLLKVQDILKNIDGVKFVQLGAEDVVRHRLVSDIIKAYNQHKPDAEMDKSNEG